MSLVKFKNHPQNQSQESLKCIFNDNGIVTYHGRHLQTGQGNKKLHYISENTKLFCYRRLLITFFIFNDFSFRLSDTHSFITLWITT